MHVLIFIKKDLNALKSKGESDPDSYSRHKKIIEAILILKQIGENSKNVEPIEDDDYDIYLMNVDNDRILCLYVDENIFALLHYFESDDENILNVLAEELIKFKEIIEKYL